MVPPAPRQRPSAMEESTIDFLLPAEQDDTDSSIEFLPPPLRQGKRPKRVRRPQGMGASQILERPQDPQLSQISERPKGQDASRKLKHSQLQETSRILDPLQQLKSSRVVGRPQRLESSHTLERPQEIDRSIQTSQPVANTKASRAPPAKDPSISSEAKERVESIERPKGKAQPSRIPDPTQRSAKGCKVPTAATSTDAAFSVPVIPRGDVDPARTSTSNVLTPVTPADSTGLKGKGSSRRVFSSTQKPDKSDEWQQAKLSATPTGLTEADQNRLVSAISEAMVDPNQEWTPPLPPKDPAKLEQYEALMQASKTLTASKASSKRLKTPRSAERQTPSAASSPPTGRLRVTRMSLLQEALVEDKNLWRSATTSMSRKSEDQATKSDSLETIDLDSSEPWAPSTPPLSPHRTGESSMVPRLTLPAPNTETAMVVRRPSGPNEDAMLDDYMVLDEDSVHYTKRTARNGTMFRNAELQRLLSSQRLALQYGAPIVGMTIAGPLVSVLDPSMTGRCIAILIGHFSRLRLRNATVRDLHRALSAAGLGTTSGQVGSLFAVLGWGALFGPLPTNYIAGLLSLSPAANLPSPSNPGCPDFPLQALFLSLVVPVIAPALGIPVSLVPSLLFLRRFPKAILRFRRLLSSANALRRGSIRALYEYATAWSLRFVLDWVVGQGWMRKILDQWGIAEDAWTIFCSYAVGSFWVSFGLEKGMELWGLGRDLALGREMAGQRLASGVHLAMDRGQEVLGVLVGGASLTVLPTASTVIAALGGSAAAAGTFIGLIRRYARRIATRRGHQPDVWGEWIELDARDLVGWEQEVERRRQAELRRERQEAEADAQWEDDIDAEAVRAEMRDLGEEWEVVEVDVDGMEREIEELGGERAEILGLKGRIIEALSSPVEGSRQWDIVGDEEKEEAKKAVEKELRDAMREWDWEMVEKSPGGEAEVWAHEAAAAAAEAKKKSVLPAAGAEVDAWAGAEVEEEEEDVEVDGFVWVDEDVGKGVLE